MRPVDDEQLVKVTGRGWQKPCKPTGRLQKAVNTGNVLQCTIVSSSYYLSYVGYSRKKICWDDLSPRLHYCAVRLDSDLFI